MSGDPRAERITAKAEAERIRAQTELLRAQVQAKLDRQAKQDRSADTDKRRAAWAARLQPVAATARQYAAPAVAIGSPEVIAWSGQYSFAEKTMKLGWLAPLLPVAIEGGTLYTAKLALEAICDDKPAGRYRFATWVQAGLAAGMNYWHGSDKAPQVGLAFALTSLLGIVMLELTVSLRRHKASGRPAEEIHRSLTRRIRYPRLSAQATAIAAARGIDAEEAWQAAWVDRYGVGPGTTRRERRTARAVLACQRRKDRDAARSGHLILQDGVFVRRAQPEANETAPAGSGCNDSHRHSDESGRRDLSAYAAGGIAEFEDLLQDQASAHGDTLELPGAGSEERSSGEEPSAQRDTSTSGDERSSTTGHERSKDECSDTAGGKSGRSNPRRRTPKTGAQLRRADRLPAVRRLLANDRYMSGAAIAFELGIPESTARRLRTRALREMDGQ